LNRSTKELVVTELHQKLKEAKLAILADYSGIKVKDITDLRNGLRKATVERKGDKEQTVKYRAEGHGVYAAG